MSPGKAGHRSKHSLHVDDFSVERFCCFNRWLGRKQPEAYREPLSSPGTPGL